ncbi:MAG TPA: hypothetical protein VFG09_10540 [Thermodesulfovibrionales bacterium]|nr:hypothetical protein [Thermodesulfovibrionales bacterium]
MTFSETGIQTPGRREKTMAGGKKKIEDVSNELNENILAVKGTLELMEASVTEDELRGLLLKAIERMAIIETLSSDMFVVLKSCLDRLGEIRK